MLNVTVLRKQKLTIRHVSATMSYLHFDYFAGDAISVHFFFYYLIVLRVFFFL